MRRLSSRKRPEVERRDEDVGRADGEGEQRAREEHILLDVWSIKQGALRLQTLPFAVVLIFILGAYFCVGAILNYNEIDADQVANPPIALPACNVQAPSGTDTPTSAEGHDYQHARHAAGPHGRTPGDSIPPPRATASPRRSPPCPVPCAP